MAHWSDRYVGMDFVAGEFDCAHFVQHVAKEEFGIDAAFDAHATHVRTQSRQLANAARELARRVDGPIDGHPVLFTGESCTHPIHIGLMCDVGGRWHVLHSRIGTGAVVQTPEDMQRKFGLVVEGYYAWAA
jgi:hypothetical protein